MITAETKRKILEKISSDDIRFNNYSDYEKLYNFISELREGE